MFNLSNSILSVDKLVNGYFVENQIPFLETFFTLVSVLMEPWVVVVIVSCIFIVAHKKHKERIFLIYSISVISAGILTGILKFLFQRHRPVLVDTSTFNIFMSPSFPSGHALTSTVVFIVGAYVLNFVLFRKRKKMMIKNTGFFLSRHFIWSASIFLVFLVGFSRIYLGVHWVSDVLAGWFFGLLISTLAIYFCKKSQLKRHNIQ